MQHLDRALVLGASERGAPAVEGVARRRGVAGAGAVGPAARSAPASARPRGPAPSSVVARPSFTTFQALSGAHAHALGGEARRRRRPRSRPPCSNRRRRRTGCRSPRRAGPRSSRTAVGIADQQARRRAGGSVVDHQARRPPLEPARDDRIGRQRALGADRDAFGEAAVAGAAELDVVHARPGDGDLGVVDVVAELALAVEVDVDVLGRRPERERARGTGSAGDGVAAGPAPGARARVPRVPAASACAAAAGGGSTAAGAGPGSGRRRDGGAAAAGARRDAARLTGRGPAARAPLARSAGGASHARTSRPRQQRGARQRGRRAASGGRGPPAGAARRPPRRCSGSNASTRFQISSAFADAAPARWRVAAAVSAAASRLGSAAS